MSLNLLLVKNNRSGFLNNQVWFDLAHDSSNFTPAEKYDDCGGRNSIYAGEMGLADTRAADEGDPLFVAGPAREAVTFGGQICELDCA
jgi:hypothetical protein